VSPKIVVACVSRLIDRLTHKQRVGKVRHCSQSTGRLTTNQKQRAPLGLAVDQSIAQQTCTDMFMFVCIKGRPLGQHELV